MELTLGHRTLDMWVFVADISDEFILRLDYLRAYDATLDVGHHVLRLGNETVELSKPEVQSSSKHDPAKNDPRQMPEGCEGASRGVPVLRKK